MDRRATTARDAGMERIKEIDRWLVAGAVGLTLAFSAVAAHAFKGHALHSPAASAPSSASAPAPSGGSGDPSGSGAGDPNADPNAGSGGGDPNAQQAPAPVPSPVVTASS